MVEANRTSKGWFEGKSAFSTPEAPAEPEFRRDTQSGPDGGLGRAVHPGISRHRHSSNHFPSFAN